MTLCGMGRLRLAHFIHEGCYFGLTSVADSIDLE
jgi:hypothetical protein